MDSQTVTWQSFLKIDTALYSQYQRQETHIRTLVLTSEGVAVS